MHMNLEQLAMQGGGELMSHSLCWGSTAQQRVGECTEGWGRGTQNATLQLQTGLQ
jgi:hypothetical protein